MWGQTERIREALETFLCVHAARPKHNIWQKTKRSACLVCVWRCLGEFYPWISAIPAPWSNTGSIKLQNSSIKFVHYMQNLLKKIFSHYLLILKLFQALFLSSVEHKRRYFKKGFSLFLFTLLKIKVLYWHLWLLKEPLTSMEPCHSTKGYL